MKPFFFLIIAFTAFAHVEVEGAPFFTGLHSNFKKLRNRLGEVIAGDYGLDEVATETTVTTQRGVDSFLEIIADLISAAEDFGENTLNQLDEGLSNLAELVESAQADSTVRLSETLAASLDSMNAAIQREQNRMQAVLDRMANFMEIPATIQQGVDDYFDGLREKVASGAQAVEEQGIAAIDSAAAQILSGIEDAQQRIDAAREAWNNGSASLAETIADIQASLNELRERIDNTIAVAQNEIVAYIEALKEAINQAQTNVIQAIGQIIAGLWPRYED